MRIRRIRTVDQPPGPDRPEDLGRVLLTENIRSVLARYENAPQSELEDYAQALDNYWYQPVDLSPMRLCEELDRAIIVAAESYDYQACESEDYWGSDAAAWIRCIIRKAATKLACSETLETDAWSFQR